MGETLAKICRDDQMPDRSTVQTWIRNDDGRRKAFERARLDGVDILADEILTIAWDGSKDTILDERGRARCDHEWLGRSRLKVESLKWILSKIAPAKFGDKMPEVIEAKRLDVEQQAQIAAVPRRIERIFLHPGDVVQDASGEWVAKDGEDALRQRISELEAQLAGQAPQTKAPALLTYDPGLPRRLDSEIASRMVTLIRDYTMREQGEPAAILDECYTVIRDALAAHFGPSGQIMEILAPA